MAGYMIVGLYNCPWFAKACILADLLEQEDPSRKFTVEMKDTFAWEEHCESLEHDRGWKIEKSPVVWEVLTGPTGRGNLIGDIDDFCEYAKLVFGLVVHISTREIEEAVCRNKDAYYQDNTQEGSSQALNIAIIHAHSHMLSILLGPLLTELAKIDKNSYVTLRVCPAPDTMTPREMNGLAMEVMDLASDVLLKFIPTTNPWRCLREANLVILMHDFEDYPSPRTRFNTHLEDQVKQLAREINDSVQLNCKVLVAPNNCRLNCFIAESLREQLSRTKVPEGYLVALGQHTVTKAKGEISRQCGLPGPGLIKRLHAWGWPGISGAWVEMVHAMMQDNFGSIQGPTAILRPLEDFVARPAWMYHMFADTFLQLQEEFLRPHATEADEDGENSVRKNLYPDMCVANAIISTVHVWLESGNVCEFQGLDLTPGCFFPTVAQSETSLKGRGPSVALPVICVGIPCDNKSWPELPQGTFMVQPSVCYAHRWYPIQKITQASHDRVRSQVGKLWEIRQSHLIYRPNKYPSSLFSVPSALPTVYPPPTTAPPEDTAMPEDYVYEAYDNSA